ncbi:hypothetical protein AK812_SmicGene27309 [Symbiodinium microadriaticum]|uniref:Uncharacterized protein n=1 Tax=Symbiodinium microadriaticum TaxID=2951 RepID=A0A1Q9D745_SYMMI|nr:hypothetical protein AK812_SmicGene27309 [Symbiodinium microadriaticum]
MLDVKKRSATSNLSEISGLTGLAPAGPIKEEEVDYSCLEWGDMDPAYRRELEQKPEVKKALQNFKRQAKAARLTPSGEFVEPNLEIPTPNNPPSLDEELKQVEITGSSLETALKSYHERHVQPSFNMLADALTAVSNKKAPSVLRALNLHQMQLSNLEGEICHRTVILHNVPPFANYKSIQGNMRYLCQAASMDFHEVVQSCSSHILSSNEAILRVVFLQQQGSREFLIAFRKSARYWRDYQDRANDRKLRIERDVPFSTRLERQPYFALLDMLSDLTPAPYGSNTFRTDLSSLQIKSPADFHEDVVDAFHMFPYAIEYHALDAALADKLCSDPGFIHKGYGGLGQVVNTAQAARGIDPLDFGRNPRASISAKAGGKGKGGRKGKARLADQSGHRGSFGEVNLDSGEFRTDYGRGDRDHRKRDWADYEVEDAPRRSPGWRDYHDDRDARDDSRRNDRAPRRRDVRDARQDVRDSRRDVRDRSSSRRPGYDDRYYRAR